MKNLKMVIFDLDGTLADTLPLCIKAFKESIEPLAGRPFTDEEIIATFGPSEEGTIRALLPEYNHADALLRYHESYRRLHDMVPGCFAGVEDILLFLEQQGILVTMVTGKGQESARVSLKRFGVIRYFRHIETGKPDGPSKDQGIHHILDTFDIHPDEALYVGDAPSDIIASRKCGVPVATVTWASTTDRQALLELHPDFMFESVEEFAAFLRKRIGNSEDKWLLAVKKIKSIADIGLIYSTDEYNRERYVELRDIAHGLMADMTGISVKTLENFYLPAIDYPTPKVDVRAFILNEDDEVLLVQEAQDGCWSLPRGWADIGSTPTESILKEIREEIGCEATVGRLIAVFDKKMHAHPPQPFYVYKMVFLCSLKSVDNTFKIAFDTLDVQFFPIDDLPTLSEDRILDSQIKLFYDNVKKQNSEVICD